MGHQYACPSCARTTHMRLDVDDKEDAIDGPGNSSLMTCTWCGWQGGSIYAADVAQDINRRDAARQARQKGK